MSFDSNQLIPTKKQLTNLPDVPMRNILNRLPVWTVLEVRKVCSRLNVLAEESLTSRRRLNIYGSSLLCLSNEIVTKKEIDEYDLIVKIKLPKEPFMVYIVLSRDLYVNSVQVITKLGKKFPNLTHLSICGLTEWPTEYRVALVKCFPKLIKLDLLPHSECEQEKRASVGGLLTFLPKLEHLEVHTRMSFSESGSSALDLALPLNNLKRLIIPYNMICENGILNSDLDLDRLNSLGIVTYIFVGDVKKQLSTEPLFCSKLKYMEAYILTLNGLIKCNWTDYSALKTVHLKTSEKTNKMRRILQCLSDLPKLSELSIECDTFVTVKINTSSAEHNWPQLMSVSRFTLKAFKCEPHHIGRLAYSFPNATELCVHLTVAYGYGSEINGRNYFEYRRALADLCPLCLSDITRTVRNLRYNCHMFCWCYSPKDGTVQFKIKTHGFGFRGRNRVNT